MHHQYRWRALPAGTSTNAEQCATSSPTPHLPQWREAALPGFGSGRSRARPPELTVWHSIESSAKERSSAKVNPLCRKTISIFR
jgi:hypothetical protein